MHACIHISVFEEMRRVLASEETAAALNDVIQKLANEHERSFPSLYSCGIRPPSFCFSLVSLFQAFRLLHFMRVQFQVCAGRQRRGLHEFSVVVQLSYKLFRTLQRGVGHQAHDGELVRLNSRAVYTTSRYSSIQFSLNI